jgi:hypothetical protein
MITILDFAIAAVPLTLATLALLVLGRDHIHGQMELIAETAQARADARSQRAVAANAANSRETPVPLEDLHMQDATSQAAITSHIERTNQNVPRN